MVKSGFAGFCSKGLKMGIVLIGGSVLLSACAASKSSPTASDSSKKENGKNGMKPYKEVVTSSAETQEGMFHVHKVEDKFLFEIPDSLFNRDMFLVTRIAKTAEGIGYGGESLNEQVVRWDKKDKKVLLRMVSYNNVANDSLPIYESVKSSNFEPILMSFDIKAIGTDSASAVIDVTELFTKDVMAIGLDDRRRKSFKISTLDESRSMIESIRSFPTNVEARNVLTYKATEPPTNARTGAISLEINNSMVLLPKEPMQARLFDQRVGFFNVSQVDYGMDAQKATKRTYIARWRLEPSDMEAFERGELVEPKKPIVYYIDPATPEKWRPYLKQGIEDWQEAFEAAGFKNAIIAKDPPTAEEDPDWSPEDARYSVVRYFASDIQNAYGPSVKDPRSGEIIESDIGWYHNVMNLLRNWYFVQTAAINPDARSVKFDDEVMGELVRFVSSHEVGHTLGLPHNMGASSAYPVDSLRSATFTEKMGTAPSIMDYARFNYIAQPGDEGVAMMPKIGIYDKHAVRWGYRPIPEANTPDEEKETLNAWIREHDGDLMYRFGRQMGNPMDPSAQTEDLGDDAMKASAYGIANLKRIVPNLIEWTAEDGKNYDDLEEMYNQVLGQWNRYMGHVKSNVGGVYEFYKSYDQEGEVYEPVPKEKQKEAITFLSDEAFQTPEWLIDTDILRRIESAGTIERIRRSQETILKNLLDPSRMARIIEASTISPDDAYTLPEMFGDLRKGIWTELSNGQGIDTYRRNLQRAHLDRLAFLMKEDQAEISGRMAGFMGVTTVNVSQSDIRPMVRGELKSLQSEIKRSLNNGRRDQMSRYHLEDALERIDAILDPRKS